MSGSMPVPIIYYGMLNYLVLSIISVPQYLPLQVHIVCLTAQYLLGAKYTVHRSRNNTSRVARSLSTGVKAFDTNSL